MTCKDADGNIFAIFVVELSTLSSKSLSFLLPSFSQSSSEWETFLGCWRGRYIFLSEPRFVLYFLFPQVSFRTSRLICYAWLGKMYRTMCMFILFQWRWWPSTLVKLLLTTSDQRVLEAMHPVIASLSLDHHFSSLSLSSQKSNFSTSLPWSLIAFVVSTFVHGMSEFLGDHSHDH
jgi:hypothetical protein